MEKAWRDEVPAANKVGDNQHGSSATCTTPAKDGNASADSILARLERAWRDEVPAAQDYGTNRHSTPREGGTHSSGRRDADSILSRLKRDDPATAQKVINGELTANAAARSKGWRKPRILLTSPKSIANGLRNHLTADELNELKALNTSVAALSTATQTGENLHQGHHPIP